MKLFFLHIPKTAGSSVLKYYSIFAHTQHTHIESDRDNNFKNVETNNSQFISGHITFGEATNLLNLSDFLFTTIIRDPIDQLLSHINWICHISKKENHEKYPNTPQEIRNLGKELLHVDFTNHLSVRKWVNNIPTIGHTLLDNCQSRYLLTDAAPTKLEPEHGTKACYNLDKFDIVGNFENISNFIKRVNRSQNLDSRNRIGKTNTSQYTHTPSTINENSIKELTPLWEIDRCVYNKAKTLSQ